MTKHIYILFALFLFVIPSISGQIVETITKTNKAEVTNKQACADQFAGNVVLDPNSVIAQSEATTLPGPIFLCYQDRFTITNENADLTGDADNSTQPGVGYAFFDCPPSVSGTTLNDIEADPCVLNTPPPPAGDYDLWVYTDKADGTALFQNSNQLGGQTIPQFFNNGNPIQIYFAPITFDNFNQNQDEDSGDCVHMNANDAFPVVYLNEIQAVNCQVNLVNNEYVGSFVVEGGMSEYNGSDYTTVAVVKNGNFNNQVELTGGPFMHGDLVSFTADEPGNYTILIQDGISCGASKDLFIEESDKQTTVTGNLPAGPFEVGDFFCVTYQVAGFDSLLSMSFTLNFDPTVLELANINPGIVESLTEFSFFDANSANGYIPFSWFQNAATGVTLVDGYTFFDLCFNVIGDPGDCVDIFIDGTPTSISASACEGPDCIGEQTVEMVFNDVDLCIEEPTDVEIIGGACGANNTDEGSITFYVVGGDAPYSYTTTCGGSGTINSSLTEVTINDLTSGNCTINVTDNNGGMASIVLNVSNDPAISYDIVTVDPVCFGVNNGAIKLRNIMGGNPDYTISWSNGFYDVDSVAFLAEGTYFATIEDEDGCRAEQAFFVGKDPIEVNLNFIDTTTCIDLENGSIQAIASGGTPLNGNRYTYQWNNPNLFDDNVVTSTNEEIPVGVGQVKVTDNNGCSVTVSYDMGFQKTVTAMIDTVPILCADSLGTLIITGGTSNNSCGTFAFNWGGGVTSINGPNTSTAADIPSGDYFVTITDCDGCMLDTMITLDNPSALNLSLIPEFECNETTGSIFAFAGGGTSPTVLVWEDDSTAGPIRNNLPPGIYTATVTDDNGCSVTRTVELSQNSGIIPDTFFVTPISCAGDEDGVITVSVLGGGPFDFAWEGPNGSVGMNDPTISNIGAGLYYVTVSDDAGCSVVDSVEMIAPDTIFITPNITPPSCNGESDGTISLIVEGGTPDYLYTWENFPGIVTEVLPAIGQGTYNVTVFDSQGCSETASVILDNPPVIDININVIDEINCFGETTGQVEVTFSGGSVDNGNYGVVWSNGEAEPLGMITSDTAFMYGAGMANVIVFDERCSDTLEFELLQPERIQIDLNTSTITDASCFGICDGTVQVAAQGGDGNFTYTWMDSGNVGPIEMGLCAGFHVVEILDGNGCIVLESVLVNQPDSLVLLVDEFNTIDPACTDEGDGLITVEYTGGNTGPVVYTWTDNVSDDASASGLTNGIYTITVTDGRGCSDTTSYTLNSAPPVFGEVPTPMEPVCFGDQTCIQVENPGGGSGTGYRFSINNSNLFPIDSCVNVFAGDYVVTIFDSDGCSYDTMIVINQPSELLANVGNDLVVNLGDSTTVVQVQLNQTFIIDTIIWESNQPYACIDPECTMIQIFPASDATYSVTAIDINGCEATDAMNVQIDDERKVYFPNVFTPNGDGINDRFQLFTGIGVTEIVVVQIYDRWGNKMYEERDVAPNPGGTIGWDGSFDGQSLDPGVYVYRAEVTFVDGKTIPYSGTITLVR